MSQRTLAFLACTLLTLSACGGESAPADGGEPQAPRSERGVPDDVPLYSEDADAKKIDYAATDTEITVTMETINGPLSPITYYRNLPSIGWKVEQDTSNAGGTLRATKDGRMLSVTFKALPEGAGTLITLKTTNDAD